MRFAIKVVILAMFVALITRADYAAPQPQNDRIRAAFNLLLKAERVNGPSVGIARARTKEYAAFETLWNSGKAAEDYALKLVSDGTPAARVYGAILLLKFNQAAAEREFRRLEKEDSQVAVFPGGCVGRTMFVKDIVRELKMGESVIPTPKDKVVKRK